ncbi:MAG: HAD family hydrolase [Gammaproteobacteria bacterium]
MTRAVFFDLGGTLYSYRNVPRATMALLTEAAERLGVAADRHQLGEAYNGAQQAAAHAYADKSYYLHRDFFQDTLRGFAERLGAAADEAVFDWYLEAHRVAIVDCLVLKEDCLDTLAHLKQRELYLSVVSNIDDDMLAPLIERGGLGEYFHHWTSSESAQSCKPDRRFFEHALELSGHAPADVLFVGDSPEHDIVGAAALGMRTALIVDGGMEPPLQTGRGAITPDHVIHNLAELKTVLGG